MTTKELIKRIILYMIGPIFILGSIWMFRYFHFNDGEMALYMIVSLVSFIIVAGATSKM